MANYKKNFILLTFKRNQKSISNFLKMGMLSLLFEVVQFQNPKLRYQKLFSSLVTLREIWNNPQLATMAVSDFFSRIFCSPHQKLTFFIPNSLKGDRGEALYLTEFSVKALLPKVNGFPFQVNQRHKLQESSVGRCFAHCKRQTGSNSRL